MVSYKDYVAGWLDSSVRAFLALVPPGSDSMKYALITCVDSNLSPTSLLDRSPELRVLAGRARTLGDGILLPTKTLREIDSRNHLFFGFDEVWFFPSDQIEPKPDAGWLVGPTRIDRAKLETLASWMSANSCSLALGDGQGLNFIVKARGLVKHLLDHSIDQPQPEAIFVAAPMRDVAG